MREACDTYTGGVFAVLALVNECRWDPETGQLKAGVKYEVGRRMTTSPLNQVSQSTVVTPDCVIQFQESHGVLAETKLGLPKNQEFWDDNINQLRKYDDDLAGWWTKDEMLSSHDLVALVPLTRAVKFADRLERGKDEGKWTFSRKIAVIGFYKTSGVKDFLGLKKERGSLSPSNLDERLRESRQVDIALLLANYNDRKFVDHVPPIPYILQIIWDHLFTRYAADIADEAPGATVTIKVTVDQVTKDLQDFYGFKSDGPRSPEIPRANWVRKALDILVLSKLASKSKEDDYAVSYKRTRADTLKKFGKICFELDQKKNPPPSNQLSLLL